MDASLCREHLENLLTEESVTLGRLEALLTKEYELIAGNDAEALDSTSTERQEYVGTLMRIEDERHSLCRAHGMSGDRVGLKKLAGWCDPQRTLQSRWSESNAKILHCRTLNDRNGALVTNRLKRVEGLLDMLNGAGTKDARVYTAKGNAYAAAHYGRVFNVRA